MMNRLFLSLALVMMPLLTRAAVPAFTDFYGTNGIVIRTNGALGFQKVQVDGSALQPGSTNLTNWATLSTNILSSFTNGGGGAAVALATNSAIYGRYGDFQTPVSYTTNQVSLLQVSATEYVTNGMAIDTTTVPFAIGVKVLRDGYYFVSAGFNFIADSNCTVELRIFSNSVPALYSDFYNGHVTEDINMRQFANGFQAVTSATNNQYPVAVSGIRYYPSNMTVFIGFSSSITNSNPHNYSVRIGNTYLNLIRLQDDIYGGGGTGGTNIFIGGNLSTNADHFAPNTTLNIKSGALLTNLSSLNITNRGDMTNVGNVGILGTMGVDGIAQFNSAVGFAAGFVASGGVSFLNGIGLIGFNSASNYVWTATNSGGRGEWRPSQGLLQTNANQFAANNTLTIKDGVLLTNVSVSSALIDQGTLIVSGTTSMGDDVAINASTQIRKQLILVTTNIPCTNASITVDANWQHHWLVLATNATIVVSNMTVGQLPVILTITNTSSYTALFPQFGPERWQNGIQRQIPQGLSKIIFSYPTNGIMSIAIAGGDYYLNPGTNVVFVTNSSVYPPTITVHGTATGTGGTSSSNYPTLTVTNSLRLLPMTVEARTTNTFLDLSSNQNFNVLMLTNTTLVFTNQSAGIFPGTVKIQQDTNGTRVINLWRVAGGVLITNGTWALNTNASEKADFEFKSDIQSTNIILNTPITTSATYSGGFIVGITNLAYATNTIVDLSATNYSVWHITNSAGPLNLLFTNLTTGFTFTIVFDGDNVDGSVAATNYPVFYTWPAPNSVSAYWLGYTTNTFVTSNKVLVASGTALATNFVIMSSRE